MDKDQLKRMLAGLSIAGLISGAGLVVSAPDALGGSSWTGKKSGAVSTEMTDQKAKGEKTEGMSSWTGDKSGAGSAEEEKAPGYDEQGADDAEEGKDSGKSSWNW